MDKAKVKNLIILILLLANGFLLFLVLADRQETREGEAAAWRELTTVFEQNGIRVVEDDVRDARVLPVLTLQRDLREEQKAVERLLGNADVQDRGGNIYDYDAKKGIATFRGSGDFEIWLEEGAVRTGSDPVGTAVDVLQKLGIDCDADSAVLRELPGGWEVVLTARLDGDDVYNARALFTFSSANLLSVSGVRLPGGAATRGETGMEPATLLMHFLRAVLEGGYVCSEVTGLTCGYFISAPGLVPVWYVETDAGDYYLNALTGRSETFG